MLATSVKTLYSSSPTIFISFSCIVSSRNGRPHWGGVLRDDAKNGCVADYVHVGKLLFPFAYRLAVS